jgi:hypothetical protein
MVELEIGQREKVFDIPHFARDQVVHAYDMVPFPDEAVTEVGSEETCRTGDQYSFLAHGGYLF